MSNLLLVGAAGFAASLVDGALGMGFGPTSSTVLLSSGMSPGAVSATVNLAKVATGVATGASHWRLGNIDRRLVLRLALPGSLGAAIGAFALTSLDGDALRALLSLLLLLVGLRILVRFSNLLPSTDRVDEAASARLPGRGVEIAGALGGVTNGLVGAWGPVVTPYLLHRGLVPRLAVGSVNTAEVAVATVASGSLLASLAGGEIDIATVAAMIAGGVVAAPLAAWSIRLVAPRVMGLGVAGLLLATNGRQLLLLRNAPGAWLWVFYAAVGLALIAAAQRPRWMRAARTASAPVAGAAVCGGSAGLPRVGLVEQGADRVGQSSLEEFSERHHIHDHPDRHP